MKQVELYEDSGMSPDIPNKDVAPRWRCASSFDVVNVRLEVYWKTEEPVERNVRSPVQNYIRNEVAIDIYSRYMRRETNILMRMAIVLWFLATVAWAVFVYIVFWRLL